MFIKVAMAVITVLLIVLACLLIFTAVNHLLQYHKYRFSYYLTVSLGLVLMSTGLNIAMHGVVVSNWKIETALVVFVLVLLVLLEHAWRMVYSIGAKNIKHIKADQNNNKQILYAWMGRSNYNKRQHNMNNNK